MTRRVTGCAAMMMCLGFAATAAAQTTAQFPIQFDFLNPGARSLALGSAFTGLADDATSAFTNPAGLLNLRRPEVSFEGRFRRFETLFLERGRVSGTVLNEGEDTIAGPLYAEDVDSGVGLSFASFVFPKDKWAVAIYGHELSNIENAFLYRGVFERATFGNQTSDRNRDLPLQGTRAIRIRNIGTAVAARLNSQVTVGGGISVLTFDLDSQFARLGLVGNTFGPVDPSVTGSTAVQSGDDTGVAFNVGTQIQLTGTFKVGAVYRRNPGFDFTQVDAIPFRDTLVRDGEFKVPDAFGVGFAWRPTDPLTIAADYVRVEHGSLKEDFINFQAISTGTEDRLAIDDGNEFHLGVEYVLVGLKIAPALRAGYWFDPDHTVRYVSDNSGSQIDQRLQFILPGGEAQNHFTMGLGLPFSSAFELNAAADISKRATYASVSAIIRFF